MKIIGCDIEFNMLLDTISEKMSCYNKYKNCCLVILLIDFERYVNFDNYTYDYEL